MDTPPALPPLRADLGMISKGGRERGGWDVEVQKSAYWISFAALRLEIHAIKLGDVAFLSISAQLVPKSCSSERVQYLIQLAYSFSHSSWAPSFTATVL